MANTVAKLNIHLGANTAALAGDLAKGQGMLTAFTAKANATGGGAAGGGGILGGMLGGSGGGLASMLGKINPAAMAATAGVAGLGALVAGATWATKLAADAEQMQVSFEVMLGSADKAKSMMSEIQGFAASTPFESGEIAAAAKSLLAFGVAQGQVIPSMRMLGDLSAGLNIPIGELSELYGKAKVQGRLFMEDINQLTGRGIPIITQLAKNFGVAESEIRGMVEKGQVGFPQLQSALNELTKEGSQFGGMMQKQSQTFWGQLSTLWDNIKIAVGGVGKSFIGILTEMLRHINAALESWNQFWGNSPKGGGKGGVLDQAALDAGMKPAEVTGKANEAADAAKKAMEDLKKAGESLAHSLRTPFERIRDDLARAKELMDAGAISGETYARAMAKAKEELRAQAETADQIRNRLSQQQAKPQAALQYGTQAAITAIGEANRKRDLDAKVNAEIARESAKTNTLLRNLITAVEDIEPTTIKTVSHL